MITHILDTNIVSRYLTNIPHFVELVENGIGFEKICISIITKIELLNWLSNYSGLTIQQRNLFKKTINAIPIKHINESISKIANQHIEKDTNSKPADTLIGSTAKYHNLFLVTTNEKDFTKFDLIVIRVNMQKLKN